MRHRFLVKEDVEMVCGRRAFDDRGRLVINMGELNRIISFVIGKRR